MKRRIALVVLLLVALAAGGASVWHFTRPSVADNLSTQANGMLNQWKSPATVPMVKSTKSATTVKVKEPTPATGSKFSVIRIPAIKLTFPIGEGTDDATLRSAVGHYTQTVPPGQIGNFAVAGHDCCASNGQPFKNLKDLRAGNMVYIDTKNATYAYKIVNDTACGVSPTVVHMSQIEVINPTPCATTVPTRKLMTLQTCTPVTHGHSAFRVMLWAELVSVTQRG